MKRQSPLTGFVVDTDRHASTDTTFFYDPACGQYALCGDEPLENYPPEDVTRIAKALATRKLRYGEQSPYLTETETGEFGSWTFVPVRELLAEYPTTVLGILDAAILNMSRMIKFPSDIVEINRETRWYIFAHDHTSQRYILRQLTEMGYIRPTMPEPADPEVPRSYSIEAKGWERLSTLESDQSDSKRAFVAMWFSASMEPVFREGILPAVREAGFECVRIDRKEHNNKICDEIVSEIRRSRLVIADFSGNRGGVYFEAGFAHGLRIPVIWIVGKQYLKNLHFDTRQYNHIVYATPEELRASLLNRIRATVTQ